MNTVKTIAVQCTLWSGVGMLIVLFTRVVFRVAYGSALSTKGATIVLAYGVVATLIGKRFSGVSWKQIGSLITAFSGLALASAPIRSFAFSELHTKDLSFVAVGIAMLLGGTVVLYRLRKTTTTSE